MGLCTEALISEVLCEDIVFVTHCNKDIAMGDITAPPGSELSGQTQLSVLDCTPMMLKGTFGLQLVFFVQEELLLITPEGDCFPLEFGFRFQEFVALQNCTEIPRLEDIFGELDCRITALSGTNRLKLRGNKTFDQCLRLTIEIRLLRERQLRIALCPPYRIPCLRK